jgi:hypothetical protein
MYPTKAPVVNIITDRFGIKWEKVHVDLMHTVDTYPKIIVYRKYVNSRYMYYVDIANSRIKQRRIKYVNTLEKACNKAIKIWVDELQKLLVIVHAQELTTKECFEAIQSHYIQVFTEYLEDLKLKDVPTYDVDQLLSYIQNQSMENILNKDNA